MDHLNHVSECRLLLTPPKTLGWNSLIDTIKVTLITLLISKHSYKSITCFLFSETNHLLL